MKRDIADLLDTYVDDSVRLDSITPLSSSRIKELTMSRIQQKQTHRRVRGGFLVAAVIAVLCMTTAVASYLGAGELFRSFFTNHDNELTPGQVETMDCIGETFAAGVTSNGATITPIAALADSNLYYLRLRVEAPEGVVLPDLKEGEGYYKLSAPDDENMMTLEAEKGAYNEIYGYTSDVNWQPDADPTDNVKEVVIEFHKQSGSDMAYNDNIPKILSIHGLWIQSIDKEYTQIFGGDFAFDIGSNYQSEAVALDSQKATYHDEVYGYTNQLEYLELSPLSLSYRYKSTMPENDWVSLGAPGPMQIVMKDGTVFYERGEDPGPASHEIPQLPIPTKEYTGYITFDAPLDLSEVDYVKYGETIIPVDVA